jgi:AraC-like DNA-binding protein
MVVKSELEKLGLNLLSVDLGVVETDTIIDSELKEKTARHLEKFGFELIDDKKSRIIEKTKTLIIDLVHNRNSDLKINLSDYLIQNISLDYNSLSNLFSEVENTTIEKFYIAQKIEKVKELIMYDEKSLSEIADKLHYSSVAHLSMQFKKVTGFTPTYFKNLKDKKRKQIEDL